MRRAKNAAGVPTQLLSVELPVESYISLRVAAAEKNINLSKFVRGLLENYIFVRHAMQQQQVPEDFLDPVPTEVPNGEEVTR